jgi:hypothetical protein
MDARVKPGHDKYSLIPPREPVRQLERFGKRWRRDAEQNNSTNRPDHDFAP